MNRINQRLTKLRADGKKAFIPYIAAGDPNLEATEELVFAFDAVGVDVIELGVPFSDPIADGPSIQRASERALRGGVSLSAILRMVERVRRSSDVPIIFMTYYNPIYHYGIEQFCQTTRQAGVDGLIVPDLSPEESGELIPPARENDLATIFLAAPTSTKDRLTRIADLSRGFVYAVSLTGITGVRDAISEDLAPMMRRLRTATDKPICVGFGIGNPEQARSVAAIADGVIVGSAIVNRIEAHIGKPDLVAATQSFVRDLTVAVKSV